MFPKHSLIKQSNQFDMDQCTVVGLLADVVYASSHLLLFKTWVHISVLNYNMLCHGCYYRNDHNTKLWHLCSGVTAGGGREQSASLTLLTGIFCWPTGKREAREKGKMEKERRKIEKGKVENWKWKGKNYKMGERTLFFFYFFFDTSCQADFASHPTRDLSSRPPCWFPFAWPGIGKHNKMSR